MAFKQINGPIGHSIQKLALKFFAADWRTRGVRGAEQFRSPVHALQKPDQVPFGCRPRNPVRATRNNADLAHDFHPRELFRHQGHRTHRRTVTTRENFSFHENQLSAIRSNLGAKFNFFALRAIQWEISQILCALPVQFDSDIGSVQRNNGMGDVLQNDFSPIGQFCI